MELFTFLKKLWDMWDIENCMIFSLLLQTLLLFASRRQSRRSALHQTVMWLVYLAAEWITVVTSRLIIRFLTDPTRTAGNKGLHALWASFLLLHLGGPVSITSYSVEDNELWKRHLFGLVFQVVYTGYCIFLSLASITAAKLWPPIILVFIVGTVKFSERTAALYLGSLDHFEATALPHSRSVPKAAPGNDMETVMHAYSLFRYFKGLFAGYTLPPVMMQEGRDYFSRMRDFPEEGFKLMECEGSFMYECLHTKVRVAGSKTGAICSLCSFCSLVLASVLFLFVADKSQFGKFEKAVSYVLLIGGIILDFISGIQLVCSDWIMVSDGFERWREHIPSYLWRRRRWCGSLPQYSITDYFIDEHRICNPVRLPHSLQSKVEEIKIMLFSGLNSDRVEIQDIKSFVFNEILGKSLANNGIHREDDDDERAGGRDDLITDTINFALEVTGLHFVTEICYQRTQRESRDEYTEEKRKERRRCKVLSDYMFYQLLMKPAMLAPVAIEDWDQMLHYKLFSDFRLITAHKGPPNGYDDLLEDLQMCGNDFAVSLIRNVLSFQESSDWGGMSRAWVEMLVKGACNCRPILHAKQLSCGGELLTFAWLLAGHLGLEPRVSYQLGSVAPYRWVMNPEEL